MNVSFLQSLELMWKGMLSIFVVIAVIFIVTFVMTRIKRKKKADNENVSGNTGT